MISREFLLAGRAVFTIEVPAQFAADNGTKPHYTYRVTKHHNGLGPRWYVKLLVGRDNEADYKYIGMVREDQGFSTTHNSALPADSWPVKIVARVVANLLAGTGDKVAAAGWEVHHQGKCGHCGRPLTTPNSVRTGIGPVCAARM